MTDALKAESPLRRRMIDDMSLCNLSPATERCHQLLFSPGKAAAKRAQWPSSLEQEYIESKGSHPQSGNC